MDKKQICVVWKRNLKIVYEEFKHYVKKPFKVDTPFRFLSPMGSGVWELTAA